jgi:hypothetical protein
MATYYKGERITELLDIIGQMEQRLNGLGITEPNQEFAQAYTTITIAKAKLTALQGRKEDECGK